MPIYQRGKNKTWWIDYVTTNGERIRRSSGTQNRQEAQELHDRLKAESWRVKELGAKQRHTWQDAVIRWVSEQGHKKSIREDKHHLRWLHAYLGSKCLDEIDKTLIDALKKAKQQSGVSNETTNRMLAVIRAILNMAHSEWEWLDSVPKIKSLPIKHGRVRWLTRQEAFKLHRELPEHLQFMMRFTLATGLRESNVTGLQWSQVDMQRRCAWINANEAKGKKAIAVPLNAEACEIISSQLGKHQIYVFTYEGCPVTRANNHAWRKALKRANIENFRWHDLRHTWASWHIQSGTPLNALKELGAWSDLSMVMRYAHLSSDHLAHYADNICGTNLAQTIKKA